jgi:hypothetical protein
LGLCNSTLMISNTPLASHTQDKMPAIMKSADRAYTLPQC